MNAARPRPAARPRVVALFPGAFRPPHRAHYQSVRHLAARADIDEVVVIVSNRCRHIPETDKALEPDLALRIWAIYLRGMDKVRVELAEDSAVRHALAYLEQAGARDHLLFCAGEADLREGRGRFRQVSRLARELGVSAEVIASSPAPLSGGATRLRRDLARGESGRDGFLAALPAHLGMARKLQVWDLCRHAMRDIHAIIASRVRVVIEASDLGKVEHIETTREGKADAALKVTLEAGECLFVKHASHTVRADRLGEARRLKPRDRIYVERNALKWLARHQPGNVAFPRVRMFHNRSKTLALSALFPDGHSLLDEMRNGRFDATLIRQAAQFLACCHTHPRTVPALRKDADTDREHWETLLRSRMPRQHGGDLPRLYRESLHASASDEGNGLFHLDLSPGNIRVSHGRIGVIDFENSSSVGDPAHDLGYFLGHCLYWEQLTSPCGSGSRLAARILDSYQEIAGTLSARSVSRLHAFALLTMASTAESMHRDRGD